MECKAVARRTGRARGASAAAVEATARTHALFVAAARSPRELVRRVVQNGDRPDGDDARDAARVEAEAAEDHAAAEAFGFTSAENFQDKFPDFTSRSLFIAGESYEGLEAENLAAVEAFYAKHPDFANTSLVLAGENEAGIDAPPATDGSASDDQ